jgi:hypothetical protein
VAGESRILCASVRLWIDSPRDDPGKLRDSKRLASSAARPFSRDHERGAYGITSWFLLSANVMQSVKFNPRIRLDCAILEIFWRLMWENQNGDPVLAHCRRQILEIERSLPIWDRRPA